MKSLLHSFKQQAFQNWRTIQVPLYGLHIWPQIVYSGIEDDIHIIAVVFERNKAIFSMWDPSNFRQIVKGLPTFLIEQDELGILKLRESSQSSSRGVSPPHWAQVFNEVCGRSDHYQPVSASVTSYHEYRSIAVPSNTKAVDIDALEIASHGYVGIEATEVWKVAPRENFIEQLVNIFSLRHQGYNLLALEAQLQFLTNHLNKPGVLRLLFHKLLYTSFDFDPLMLRVMRPKNLHSSYRNSYFLHDGHAVLDEESLCVSYTFNRELLVILRQLVKLRTLANLPSISYKPHSIHALFTHLDRLVQGRL